MQVLTPSGYVDASTLQVGDSVCAFDEFTGAPIVNQVESIAYVDLAEWQRWWKPMVDSGELADYPPFDFYEINGTWTLNSEQSIWRNGTNVCHVRDLVVGDTIYDDADNPVLVTSVAPLIDTGWYRFDIDGDHSYIADGLTLHNASRFWVTGTGTWDSSTTTHWAASSGGAGSQTVPGSADTVTFDGSSGGGTVTLNFGGTITVQSITLGAFTGTWTNNVNHNNVTLSANGFSGTGSGVRTVNLGNGTYSLTSTTTGITPVDFTTVTNLTFTANSSTFDFTGAVGAGTGQNFQAGGLTFNILKVSGARFNSGLQIGGGGTIATLNVAAACSISLNSSTTITTLTQSAQCEISPAQATTLTLTNAPTLTGTLSAPLSFINANSAVNATTATITCSSGTFSGTCIACKGVTFSGTSLPTFTDSFDLGRSNGATITAPNAGGPVGQFISHQRGTPY